ncbi:MAG: hypothetical protein MJ193_00410 [Clostridia bacterium]|nr:hypothetical protein [Clostridia bacterium]
MKEPKLHMYIVETVNKNTGEHFPYYQEAYNPQKAVDRIKCFIADEEEIVQVCKVLKCWQA